MLGDCLLACTCAVKRVVVRLYDCIQGAGQHVPLLEMPVWKRRGSRTDVHGLGICIMWSHAAKLGEV